MDERLAKDEPLVYVDQTRAVRVAGGEARLCRCAVKVPELADALDEELAVHHRVLFAGGSNKLRVRLLTQLLARPIKSEVLLQVGLLERLLLLFRGAGGARDDCAVRALHAKDGVLPPERGARRKRQTVRFVQSL